MTTTGALAIGAGEPGRAEQHAAFPGVDELLAELRAAGFDLRRATQFAYLVDTAADRAAAYAVRDAARRAGWKASLFGDSTGWVVRLARTGPPHHDVLRRAYDEVERLARGHGRVLRGVCVEVLQREDLWDTLAAKVSRTPEPEPAPLPSVSTRRRTHKATPDRDEPMARGA